MNTGDITKRLIELGLSTPDSSDFARRQAELDKFCQVVSGDGLTPATGIGAQFNPEPEMTTASMAALVGCTEEEMRRYLEEN